MTDTKAAQRPRVVAPNVVYLNFPLLASFPADPLSSRKRSELRRLMRNSMVLTEVDATIEAVDVPAQHRANPNLQLNLSYRFGLPFRADLHGIWATLTFGGSYHACVVPWAAVRGLVAHQTGERITF
jgi:hypothetical protein